MNHIGEIYTIDGVSAVETKYNGKGFGIVVFGLMGGIGFVSSNAAPCKAVRIRKYCLQLASAASHFRRGI